MKEEDLQTISYRQEIQPSDLGAILNIVQGSGFFSNAEIELACELATDRLEHGLQSSYQFLFAENGDRVVGYTCYGLIPATAGSYDLYWIAVAETMRGRGLLPVLNTCRRSAFMNDAATSPRRFSRISIRRVTVKLFTPKSFYNKQ